MRDARGLVILFALSVLAPEVILAILGFRSLDSEKSRAVANARERLQEAVTAKTIALDAELDRIRALLDSPLRVAAAGAPEGSFVLYRDDRAAEWAPPDGLVYSELSATGSRTSPAELAAGLEMEIRHNRQEEALELYRRNLASTDKVVRAWSLHLTARVLRKLGRMDEAARSWKQMLREPDEPLGELPSQLLAGAEVASYGKDAGLARALLQDLLRERWQLSRATFSFYWTEMFALAGRPAELQSIADSKLAFADSVHSFARRPGAVVEGGRWALWKEGRDGLRAILIPAAEALQRLAGSEPDRSIRFILTSANGGANGGEHRTYASSRHEPRWRVEGWFVGTPREMAEFEGRRQWYRFMLSGLLLVLIGGSVVMWQVIRKQVAVNAMKSEFVATVSHEFRSPLHAITHLVDLLRRGKVTSEERRAQYYDLLAGESARLTRMVENLLDFSRLEAGRYDFRFQPVAVSEWLGGQAEAFRHDRVRVEASIAPGLPRVMADPEALGAAVRNLLDNAAKYSPECNTIWLSAETRNGGVDIRVKDRGMGIPPEVREKIFERFYRRPGEVSRQIKGVGLGLALTRQIVLAHGGEISVESAAGEGSVFTIHLKAAS
ncbi:MAG: HAMP domain-containing histidine kinase [Acidobacteria bacterium]|nr:HAMP domain-containing histidine kinase [Acidobacteriota bacterium]